MYAPDPHAGFMVSGSADEHIRVWNMSNKKVSSYISIKRPADKDLLQYK
jgi:WD40 repeat protein